jgi:hypothetical protein
MFGKRLKEVDFVRMFLSKNILYKKVKNLFYSDFFYLSNNKK